LKKLFILNTATIYNINVTTLSVFRVQATE